MHLRRFIAATLATASLALASEPPIRFTGFVIRDGRANLALTDTAAGLTRWVAPGATFRGYTLTHFDPIAERVTLAKHGQQMQLALASSRALAAGTAETNTAAAIRQNLVQLTAAAYEYQLARRVAVVTVAELVGPDKTIQHLKSIDGEDYSALVFGAGHPAPAVTTAQGVRVVLDPVPVIRDRAIAAR